MNTEQLDRLREIVRRCAFPPWTLAVVGEIGHPAYLQVSGTGPDNHNPHRQITWRGRKWRLSEHMTETEVVKTALLAVLNAQQHETLERFTYCGATIFDPHISVDALLSARLHWPLDARTRGPRDETA